MTDVEASRPSDAVTDAGTDGGDYFIEPGQRVAVTGAGGFIGSSVVRELRGRGANVLALIEPGSTTLNLDDLDIDVAEVDIRDVPRLTAALESARTVFHMAAIYRFWAADPHSFYDVNVKGTLNVMEACRNAAVGRIVYTSTVGTLGLRDATLASPVDETSYAEINHLFGLYKQSKYVAEHEVLRAAAEGLPVVLVQPTAPVGPRDRGPTPTGAIVLDFLNGRMPGFVETTLNVVDVEDVARGHVLAAERGRIGRSYLLGGENLSLEQLLRTLAQAVGIPAPTRRVPSSLALGAAWISDIVEGRMLHRQPSIPLEGARMATTHMSVDDARARGEIGYSSRPAADALARAAHWFAETGHVKPERLNRFEWRA